jgi:hypothetical protein
MALKSLLVRDFKDLSQKLGDAIKYVDIDYEVKRDPSDPWTTHTRSMICRNDYAILNAYRMWLQSKHYDYIRNPDFGGFFENNLNDRFPFKPESELAVAQALVAETNQKWPDIELISVTATCNMSTRGWEVHVIAKDKGTNMVLSDNIAI